ncbi:MAG: SMI1/KNR4 family protein [Chlamydiota bacterium]|nr:SMI1/KNR4 family protein [Chlamydiota bacterium]
MDYHFKEFFHEFSEDLPTGNFHKVIALHEAPDITWKSISEQVPSLSRAWFELAQLTKQDRIEFLNEYWQSKLPYHHNLSDFLTNFFGRLDEIGIFITQKKFDDPFEAQLVYSLTGDSGFYRGAPPASEVEIQELQASFSDVILPQDYLTFLQIHNGFFKTTDSTGLTTALEMKKCYDDFQEMFKDQGTIYTQNNQPVNPNTLIPFYKSFGMPFYQCFWSEWYPENEMGVVYFSETTKTVSDVSDGGTTFEHLCFPTFTDWLIFYLEPIDS